MMCDQISLFPQFLSHSPLSSFYFFFLRTPHTTTTHGFGELYHRLNDTGRKILRNKSQTASGLK